VSPKFGTFWQVWLREFLPPSARMRAAVIPTIAAAFQNHSQLDVNEVLALCAPALSEELRRELREERQQLIKEIRTRLR
jgi:hypothetical protein